MRIGFVWIGAAWCHHNALEEQTSSPITPLFFCAFKIWDHPLSPPISKGSFLCGIFYLAGYQCTTAGVVSEPWGRATATAWRLAGKSLVLPWASALMQKWLQIFLYSKPSDAKPDHGVTEPCLRNFCSANMRKEHGGTSPLCFLLRSIMKKTTNPF